MITSPAPSSSLGDRPECSRDRSPSAEPENERGPPGGREEDEAELDTGDLWPAGEPYLGDFGGRARLVRARS